MNKSFYIETFGCQMNKNDSALMKFSLKQAGCAEASCIEEADIAVYNTCSVRQHAEDRVLARISSDKKHIKARGGIVVVAGCMSQRIGGELIDKGIADVAIGPYESPAIGKKLAEFLTDGANPCGQKFLSANEKDFESRLNFAALQTLPQNVWSEWLTITHGCENFCAYCIVPATRGKLISFNSGDILAYAKALTERGVREITLLGQNVNQFGQDTGDIPFYSLLEKTAALPNLERLNFLTSHPKDFSQNIVKVIADNSNISRCIHLPLQSGSDKILAAMNRQYTVEQYMQIIETIDKHLSDYSITTDLIVGFPGETEFDYACTVKAVNSVMFDEAFTYAYSPREGTPAFALEENISRKEKLARLSDLIELQRGISKQKLSARINCIEDIIPERVSRRSAAELVGRTFLNHTAVLAGERSDIGRRIKVKIEAVKGSTLWGQKIA